MIRTGTPEQALANRRHLRLANGTGYWRSDFIRSEPTGEQVEGGWSLSGEVSWNGEKLPRIAVAFADEVFEFQGEGSVLCLQFPC